MLKRWFFWSFITIIGLLFLGPIILVGSGWLKYKHLESSIVGKMDQYFLNITTPGREEYLLEEDEVFEVPYMASKWSAEAMPTRIYDRKGRLVGEYVSEKGIYVRDPDKIPTFLKKALVATEDRTFYEHHGVNYKAIARAMLVNLKNLQIRQGGSTLTQQLAKILFTTRERTYGRKVFEVFVSKKLESKFRKDQILLMYLNFAYFGHGCFGVESASQFYFRKPASALELGEAALLAGLIASPENYSPFRKHKLSLARHRTVLRRMAKVGYIPASSVERYSEEFWQKMEDRLKTPEVSFWRMKTNQAPYFIEHVRRKLAKTFRKERILKGGLRIHTTLDLEYQKAAKEAFQEGIWRAEKSILETNKNKKEKRPPLEGGLAAIHSKNGAILAMVGGRGFNFQNQLVRATDIARPTGSAIKPFIFAVAFESGEFKAEDKFTDEVARYKMGGGRYWAPRNYGNHYFGEVTLATALQKSLNTVAVKLLKKVDLDRVIELISQASGTPIDNFPRNLSLALGTADLSPMQMASAYSIFANGGYQVEPYFIERIEDRNGEVIEEHRVTTPPKRILAGNAALLTLELMKAVLKKGGTAYGAAIRTRFNISAAGKTGTTDNYRDAWFAGVTPDIAASVWVGYDDMQIALGPGKTGGFAAAPIWMRFIKETYRTRPTQEFDKSLFE